MFSGNIKLAIATIKRTKLKSVFTTLGVVIAVVSVLTTISLGQGVKHEVNKQIKETGRDLIVVRPGQVVNRNESGDITDVNVLSTFAGSGSLRESDVETVSNSQSVQKVAPLSLLNGVVSYNGEVYSQGKVIGTSSTLLELLNHKVEYGEFLSDTDEGRKYAVIGKGVAEEFFKENVPIGKSLEFRGETYTVKGVMAEFETSPLAAGIDYNKTIFVPYVTGKAVSEGQAQVVQILAKPASLEEVSIAQDSIHEHLLSSHGGQEDFSVLKQEDILKVTDSLLNMVTTFVATIAAVSLLVGGIGIMNIMIASVTERTREIGVRKAVGATDSQIMGQFLAEAGILSALGAVVGIIATLVICLLLRIFTDLAPSLPLPAALAAFSIAVVVGTIFGVVPAVSAARKDPITALRHE